MIRPRDIIVTDDDETMCEQLSDVLEDAGYRPLAFNSGEELLAHLDTRKAPELILLDVHMGGMTGVDVMRTLSSMPVRHHVILVTGHAEPRTAAECLRLGAEDYITKPLDVDLLLLTLERVTDRLALRERHRDLQEVVASRRIGAGLKLEHHPAPDRTSLAFKRLAGIVRARSAERGDVAEVASEIAELARELLSADLVSVLLDDSRRAVLREGGAPIAAPRATHAPHEAANGPTSAARADVEAVLKWIAATGETVLDGVPRSGGPLFPSPVFRTYPHSAYLPLVHEGARLGAIQASRGPAPAGWAGPRHRGRIDPRGRGFADDDLQVLEVLAAQLALLQSNAALLGDCQRLTVGAMRSLAAALRHKDNGTAEHSERGAQYVARTVERMGLPKCESDLIGFAMQLHDIGKIRVPGHIINKPGPLDDDEWAIMKMHPVWGYEILNNEGMMADIAVIVRHHHERWDGAGYPDGRRAEEIPLGARILAVADSFDAMTSDRPYRKARPAGQCLKEIRAEAGKQFDPDVARVFVETVHEFREMFDAPTEVGVA